jgi:hypothetical protein
MPSRASTRDSIRETAVTVFCGCLLVAILAPACLLAEHWIEEAGHRFAGRMLWHEPVESWNQ